MSDILVVVDMQNDFIDGSLGTKEAEQIVDKVAKEMDGDYDFIFCTRDTHDDNYLASNEGRHLPVVHCVKDSEGWMLADKVQQALNNKDEDSYMIINKPVFGSEKLVDLLREYDRVSGIGSITLLGLCTDICVVANALLIKTAFPEIPVRVKKDCCAGVTVESHKAALETMKMCQIEIE